MLYIRPFHVHNKHNTITFASIRTTPIGGEIFYHIFAALNAVNVIPFNAACVIRWASVGASPQVFRVRHWPADVRGSDRFSGEVLSLVNSSECKYLHLLLQNPVKILVGYNICIYYCRPLSGGMLSFSGGSSGTDVVWIRDLWTCVMRTRKDSFMILDCLTCCFKKTKM